MRSDRSHETAREAYEHAVRFDVIQRDTGGVEESLERSNLIQPKKREISLGPFKAR